MAAQFRLALLVALLGFAGAHRTETEADSDFAAFVKKQGRTYVEGTPEYQQRKNVFEDSVKKVAELNARPNRLYTAGINHLADWNKQEYSRLLGWKGSASSGKGQSLASKNAFFLRKKTEPLPEEKNWTHLNVLSYTVDQGGCGSCWAVASSRLLASHSEIWGSAATPTRNFSTQELVDCTPNPLNCGGKGGCDGATVTLAMDYVMRHGDTTIPETPYQAADGVCTNVQALSAKGLVLNSGGRGNDDTGTLTNSEIMSVGIHLATEPRVGTSALSFGMRGWERLPENKELPLRRALAQYGPVAVSVDASGFQLYESGILDDCQKDAIINHAVLMVGYGKKQGAGQAAGETTKVWQIQNSWGEGWGENGHIFVLRHDNEEDWCGTDNQPEDGSGCDVPNAPTSVHVCGSCGLLYESVIPYFF